MTMQPFRMKPAEIHVLRMVMHKAGRAQMLGMWPKGRPA